MIRKFFLYGIAILGILGWLAYAFLFPENTKVKQYGGSADYVLPVNEKLVNITWKEDNLWILTKPMTQTDSAETYIFAEKSTYGIMEGSYKIIEVKSVE